MTNELEKQFFDTFGIEPKTNREYGYTMAIYNEAGTEEVKFYPQISDRILLGLICILTKRFDYADQNWLTKCDNAEALKVAVLRLLLLCTSEQIKTYKHQVRTLFEEG